MPKLKNSNATFLVIFKHCVDCEIQFEEKLQNTNSGQANHKAVKFTLRFSLTAIFSAVVVIFTRVVIYVEILGLIPQTGRCGCTLIRIQAKTFFRCSPPMQ